MMMDGQFLSSAALLLQKKGLYNNFQAIFVMLEITYAWLN